MAVSCCVMFGCICKRSWNHFPFRVVFGVENRQRSEGVKTAKADEADFGKRKICVKRFPNMSYGLAYSLWILHQDLSDHSRVLLETSHVYFSTVLKRNVVTFVGEQKRRERKKLRLRKSRIETSFIFLYKQVRSTDNLYLRKNWTRNVPRERQLRAHSALVVRRFLANHFIHLTSR